MSPLESYKIVFSACMRKENHHARDLHSFCSSPGITVVVKPSVRVGHVSIGTLRNIVLKPQERKPLGRVSHRWKDHKEAG
jgi:hypothetical protein